MPPARLLVIEDDEPIRRGIVDALEIAGHHTIEAPDGPTGLDHALGADIDLVLLDVLLPNLDGFAVLEAVRSANPTLPVIMLTARGTEEDRVRGLRGGADDYVVKPFSAKELIARVEAVLRRSPARPETRERIVIAGRTIDFARREITRPDGSVATMSARECDLLGYLAAHRERAVSREELLERVWGIDPRGVQTRTVDMHVARLRETLADDPNDAKVIQTVRAKGYRLGSCDPNSDDSDNAA